MVPSGGEQTHKSTGGHVRAILQAMVLACCANGMYWRYNGWLSPPYPGCQPIPLPEGFLVSHNADVPNQYIRSGIYHPQCYDGVVPVLDTNTNLLVELFVGPLPIIRETWQQFTHNGSRGGFAYSIVPIIYSVSILAVVTWFLTLFVMTNYTVKPSFLLKISTLLSSAYMLVTVVKLVVNLHGQQKRGYLHGPELLKYINNSTALNVIDLILVILLQINQVQVIMRIFSRQKDKRLTFLIGIIACISFQVIWAITQFHVFDADDEAGDILPAFIYLGRIAMGACYAALISVFIVTKFNDVLLNKHIWLLSGLTIVFIYSPVAFFAADISNMWVNELSDIFSVVTYVICVVIPWEWCNKYNLILKKKEKEGVLGRPFYEDEVYELDRYEIFIDKDSDEDNDPGTSTSRSSLSTEHSEPTTPANARAALPFVLRAYEASKKNFLSLTDAIIATGLAIPRSVSVSTLSSNPRPETVPLTTIPQEREPEDTNSQLRNGRQRNNVFVYSRKEVVIDFDDPEP